MTTQIFLIAQRIALFVMTSFPMSMFAQGSGTSRLSNPLGSSGVNNIPDLITKALEIVVMVGTPLVAIGIIWAGFCFIRAQGEPGALKECRSTLMWTVIGGLFVLGAFQIADTVQETVKDLVTHSNHAIEYYLYV